jgi:hypothetical protein
MGTDGRLGNQLFQLAALMGIAARKGTTFKLPFENTQPNFTRFANPATKRLEPMSLELPRAFGLPGGWFATWAEIHKELTFTYRERQFRYDPEAMKVADGTNLSGYFQSERYFAHVATEVRDALRFHPPIRAEARRILDRIANGLPRVAIHVRRGDYLALQHQHTVLPPAYYCRAMAQHSADGPRQFLVFSDDPDWCAEAFPGCRILHTGNTYLDLCLMSMCDHFIIANSSFSWWGAWLSPAPGKRVVCPSQWWGPTLAHNGIQDLFPEGWRPI